jgi:kynurenine formamidase
MEWLRELSANRRYPSDDRLGMLNTIDDRARLRGRDSIVAGQAVSLARPLLPETDPSVVIEPSVVPYDPESTLNVGIEKLSLQCHGLVNTHIDALSHMSWDGTWYGRWEIDDPDGPSIVDWYDAGIFTRAVHADISAVRGTDWVAADTPVSGDDIQMALEGSGVSFQPGDALLLDMGRDRFEAAGNSLQLIGSVDRGFMQPGVGVDGAAWIADHQASVVCWDFQDSIHPDEHEFPVHGLTWAIGLALVDNCSFGALRSALRDRGGAPTGAFSVSPLPVPRGTGCNVNPLLVL